MHRIVSYGTNLTLEWLVTSGNVDEGQLMMPLLAKTVFDGVRPKEAVFDNGYASYWNYEIPHLLGIKLLIGKRAMMGWRGNPKTSSSATKNGQSWKTEC